MPRRATALAFALLACCHLAGAGDLPPGAAPLPLRDGEAFLFRFHAPEARNVFLAGSFNGWASNDGGAVSDPSFAMAPAGDGLWTKELALDPGPIRYKYVVQGHDGSFTWEPDPHVEARDADSNTVLDLRTLLPGRYVTSVPGRALEPAEPVLPELGPGPAILDVDLARTWVRPSGKHELEVLLAAEPQEGVLVVRTTRDLSSWEERAVPLSGPRLRLEFPAGGVERPITVELLAAPRDGAPPSSRWLGVLPVAQHPADDLRYGFHANWDRVSEDYPAKADLLADLLLNAVEYYDYFPAHGKYAPTDPVYEFEPFHGNKIHAADIAGKIEAGRERGILAIAYVAAYAASRSVYEAHPHPMTDAEGTPLVFNGRVLPEDEADRLGERKWFWLMAIGPGSPWRAHIMEEFRRTLTDEPGDLVAFDGLEIDSYGHEEDARYYSPDGAANGELLSDVIAGFIEETWRMAHQAKDPVAVSFNCVNEFGIHSMHDISDFLFVENWAFHKPGIEETVDICHRHREPARRRVVLKMYPADAGFTSPPVFPPGNLRLMLGMCIAGGGSLMIAGEPDERSGAVHALNTLYYPDNVPLPPGHVDIVRAYNQFDAMLHGLNHGRAVRNMPTDLLVPGCVVRGFESDTGERTLTFLHHGEASFWNQPLPDERQPLSGQEIAIRVPDTEAIAEVLYASPDLPAHQKPFPLDFERKPPFIRVLLPDVHTLGVLVLRPVAPATETTR